MGKVVVSKQGLAGIHGKNQRARHGPQGRGGWRRAPAQETASWPGGREMQAGPGGAPIPSLTWPSCCACCAPDTAMCQHDRVPGHSEHGQATQRGSGTHMGPPGQGHDWHRQGRMHALVEERQRGWPLGKVNVIQMSRGAPGKTPVTSAMMGANSAGHNACRGHGNARRTHRPAHPHPPTHKALFGSDMPCHGEPIRIHHSPAPFMIRGVGS